MQNKTIEEEIKEMKQEIGIILKQVSDTDGRVIHIMNLVDAIHKKVNKPLPIIATGEIG